MADELDPRLEASLRAALHHEADQLPLLVRVEDIERARRQRGRRRLALPASLLAGGGFLVLCDAVARTILAPAELPVGILTAVIGGPWFIAILLRGRKGGRGWMR